VRESRFTSRDRAAGQESRPSREDFLSPISEEYVEELNLMIPAIDPGIEEDSGPSQAERTRQIRLILASRSFRSAPLLQKFLEFIISESSEGRQKELSEYAIATQVFGRPSNFDPASDTIVRAQAYRLRSKLKEYYENEGKEERVIVEVPKGHYVPTFSFRQDAKAAAPETDDGPEDVDPSGVTTTLPLPKRQSRLILIGTTILAIALVFAAGAFFGSRWVPQQSRSIAKTPNVPEPIDKFWGQFIGENEIILAYTNAVFLETETNDLVSFRNSGAIADRGALVNKEVSRSDALNPAMATGAGTLYYEEGFTGTGEVLATYRLASLLTALGAKVQLKRSRLVNADDLRNHDVIFLGSPFDNEVLAEMRLPQRFSFEQPRQPPYLWRGRIVDHGASSGVSYGIERDPQSQVIRADYALFDVLPGPAPGRRIVVLAGITTTGTQGAAEFATSADGLRQILALHGVRQDKSGGKSFPRYFECVLRVEAEKGLEAVNVKLVDGSAVPTQK
jgi:hypothetical protein